MKKLSYLTILSVIFIFSSVRANAETWKVNCNTCSGEREGLHICTTIFCGNIDIKINEPVIDCVPQENVVNLRDETLIVKKIDIPEKTGSLSVMLSTDNEYRIKLQDKFKAITLKADYNYRKIEVVDIDRGSLGVFYDKELNDRWKVWFYNIRKFDNVHETRDNFLGAGPKFYILKGDHRLSFSTGVIYVCDHITGKCFGRYSNRPKWAYKKDLAVVYYNQPAINDSSDYIEKLEAWAIVPYTGRHFKLIYIKEYQSKVGLIDHAKTELWANFKF